MQIRHILRADLLHSREQQDSLTQIQCFESSSRENIIPSHPLHSTLQFSILRLLSFSSLFSSASHSHHQPNNPHPHTPGAYPNGVTIQLGLKPKTRDSPTNTSRQGDSRSTRQLITTSPSTSSATTLAPNKHKPQTFFRRNDILRAVGINHTPCLQ